MNKRIICDINTFEKFNNIFFEFSLLDIEKLENTLVLDNDNIEYELPEKYLKGHSSEFLSQSIVNLRDLSLNEQYSKIIGPKITINYNEPDIDNNFTSKILNLSLEKYKISENDFSENELNIKPGNIITENIFSKKLDSEEFEDKKNWICCFQKKKVDNYLTSYHSESKKTTFSTLKLNNSLIRMRSINKKKNSLNSSLATSNGKNKKTHCQCIFI